MPELPEVETVCRGLDQALRRATIKQVKLMRPDLRMPFPAGFEKQLKGRVIQKISRRAKYLLWYFDSDDILIAHLGMSGSFRVEASYQKRQHDHVIIELHDGRWVTYHDPRRFGLMTLTKAKVLNEHSLLAHLGPEPLEAGFNAAYLKQVMERRTGTIKAALMDQEVVVGVGNIYASEALFITGLHPIIKSSAAAARADVLVVSIQKVLQDAIRSGGSSLKDFIHVNGEAGYFQHHFSVYDREGEPCEKCKTPIRNIRIAGRSSFFCPKCQQKTHLGVSEITLKKISVR